MTEDKLKEYILDQIAHDDEGELLESENPSVVLLYDYQFGREIEFNIKIRSQAAFEEIVHFGPSLQAASTHTPKIARMLLRLGRDVTMTLKRIFIVQTPDDMYNLCWKFDIDEEMLPDKLFDEDERKNEILNPSLIGLHWFQESTVIINIDGIKRIARECYPKGTYAYTRELEVGFWTTLIHEIRHNQVDSCPYDVSWIHDSDTTEQAVESWALARFEELNLG